MRLSGDYKSTIIEAIALSAKLGLVHGDWHKYRAYLADLADGREVHEVENDTMYILQIPMRLHYTRELAKLRSLFGGGMPASAVPNDFYDRLCEVATDEEEYGDVSVEVTGDLRLLLTERRA